MASGRKLFLLPFLIITIVTDKKLSPFVHGKPQVPCYFIFGDSLVDSGNNNNLATLAKVNYLPYGIDFPDGPTGRFCNGRTTADIIGELLGFHEFIPSFLKANGSSKILKGVNYASGTAGIRPETGKVVGEIIDLDRQLQNHHVIISHIVDMLGNSGSAIKYLNKCLYTFTIGSNDYLNNYFLPQYYNTSKLYTLEQYAEVLIEEYSQKLRSLYNSGARKVALSAIGPIGCIPASIASSGTNGSLCVDYLNNAVNLFNSRLQLLVNQLNSNLTDAEFLYLNSSGFVSQYLASNDFELERSGCCKVNQLGLCIPHEAPCENRNLHLFWDSLHPTEIGNRIAGEISYISLKKIL